MEQLASLNADAIKVVGVGILDNQELAESFQEQAGSDAADLVWSESRDIWETYGVSGQHTTILLDSSGAEIQRWNNFDPNAVAAAVG